MTFKDYGQAGLLQVECDHFVECDNTTRVKIRTDIPGVNQLPQVMQQLRDIGWHMTLIQDTWPGITLCGRHNSKTIEFEKLEITQERYAELMSLTIKFYSTFRAEPPSELTCQDLIKAMDASRDLERFVINFVAEPFGAYPASERKQ